MPNLPRPQWLSKLAAFGLIARATAAIAGCSTGSPGAGPTATTVGKPSSSAAAGG